MKQAVYFFVVLSVLLGASTVTYGFTFEGDASYLVGLDAAKDRGLAVHAKAEIISRIFADGSFLSSSARGENDSDSQFRHQVINAGGLYRVVQDPDLHVFVGAGFNQLTVKNGNTEDMQGRGLYGKFGFTFIPLPKMRLMADVSYTPRYRESEEDTQSTLTIARATVSYEVFNGLELQGTVRYHGTPRDKPIRKILVGGGVAFSF